MSKRLICGRGINDSNCRITRTKQGKTIWRCPYYVVWSSMLFRCYSAYELNRKPTYKDCHVCKEWLLFSNFKAWMEAQDWEGRQLDKDILGDGKLYSPGTCCFVPQWLNSLFHPCTSKCGLPIGVSRAGSKFKAQLRIDGVVTYLGLFLMC